MRRDELAEGVGFEPTRAFALPVFKTGAINRSTTPPKFRPALFWHLPGTEQDAKTRSVPEAARLLHSGSIAVIVTVAGLWDWAPRESVTVRTTV